MLTILIDAGVVMFLVAAVNDDEQVELLKAGIVGVVMSLVCGLGIGFFGDTFGLWGVLIGLVPIAALIGLVAWVAFGLTLTRAMILGAGFLAWKVGFVLVLTYFFG